MFNDSENDSYEDDDKEDKEDERMIYQYIGVDDLIEKEIRALNEEKRKKENKENKI